MVSSKSFLNINEINPWILRASEPQILAHCGRRLLQRAGGAPPAILSAAERHGWAHGRLEPWSTMENQLPAIFGNGHIIYIMYHVKLTLYIHLSSIFTIEW